MIVQWRKIRTQIFNPVQYSHGRKLNSPGYQLVLSEKNGEGLDYTKLDVRINGMRGG
jgi:hypothetical protein